jgi:uncharacterized membrane protein
VRHEMMVVIDRPIEEVWAFMAELFNVPGPRGQKLEPVAATGRARD